MTADHVPMVARLEQLCFSDPWSENSIASELQNPLSIWLVAVDDGILVGYVGSQSVQGEADMMNIAVHPDRRRQGVARMLVMELVNLLVQQDNTCLTLEVRDSNTPAILLYESMGFQQIGLRRNYYRHPREDARILRKTFPLDQRYKELAHEKKKGEEA